MRKTKIASLLLVVTLIAGGLVNSSTAAVTIKDYTAEELDSSTYDIRKYTEPFWEGNIVYNEIVYPIRDENGKIQPYELMYEPTSIVSVRNYRLDETYCEGTDYYIIDGKFFVNPAGNISIIDYDFIHPESAPAGYGKDAFSPYYPHADGSGYEYWVGGSEICDKALAVTYIHNDSWDAPVPESMESALPNTMSKLMNKEDMTIVVAGDSVSTGAMGSGFLGISPYADAYPEMTAEALRQKFGNENIKLVNSAIGGTMSHFDETKMNNTIIKYAPDLVIINFGMNDSSCDRVGISGEEFHHNLVLQIDYIKDNLPECEILLLSSLYGNRYTFPAERYEEHAAVLHTLSEEYAGKGVGVCDPQYVEKYLIEETGKDFLCFMADNMVHPNDFGMRLMAQSILNALDVADIPSYKELLISNMMAHADPDNHVDDGKKQELLDLIERAADDIADLTNEWDINEVISKAYDDVNFVLKRCAFEDHVFDHILTKPTCKNIGYTHSICTVCGFEYDHSETPALGGEHIMDSGRQSISPTYKTEGVFTYTCIRCGFENNEAVPMRTNAPILENKGMLHVSKSYNYMESNLHPYRTGSGYIEMDVCPLDIDVEGTPYIGVWFSKYAITACYNFRLQQVEIIATTLPYAGGTPFASKKVDWTPDSGEFEYNWKKFAVNVEGNTVKIYLDGELVLSHTNELYSATTELGLAYSVGEYYLDNIKVAGAGYDPVTGIGEDMGYWDFDSDGSEADFWNHWGNSYSSITRVHPTAVSVTSGSYKIHNHLCTHINTVDRGCNLSGYKEYSCDICSKVFRLDIKEPIYADGHTLTNKLLLEAPTEFTSGRYGYSCKNCYMTFTEIIPAGTDLNYVLKGDINNDGVLNYIDFEHMRRFMKATDFKYDMTYCDMNDDSDLDNEDIAMYEYMTRRLNNKAS